MTILYKSIFALIILLCASCASIVNSPNQKIRINCDPNLTLLFDSSTKAPLKTITKKNNDTVYLFKREHKTITLFETNSGDTLQIKPHRDFIPFYIGNLYMGYGLGLFIDLFSDRSFAYPRNNYFVATKNGIINTGFEPFESKKANITLTQHFPTNLLISTQNNNTYTAFASIGFSIGLDYHINANRFLHIETGFASTTPYFLTFDTHNYRPDGFFTNEVLMKSQTIRMYYNKRNNDFGIGLAFVDYKWRKHYNYFSWDFPTEQNKEPQLFKSRYVGISSAINHSVAKNLKIGIEYTPSFYDFYQQRFAYQHTLSTTLTYILKLQKH